MENPFESGHIKNYLLLYTSVVVIMLLFFVASTLFHDVKEVEQKTFDTNISNKTIIVNKIKELKRSTNDLNITLMDKRY